MFASSTAVPVRRERKPVVMTPAHTQHTTRHEQDNRAQLLALLKEGQETIRHVLQHACLLERRLRGGGEPADLVVLVQALKFAGEELHTLLQSAEQVVVSARTSIGGQGVVATVDTRESG